MLFGDCPGTCGPGAVGSEDMRRISGCYVAFIGSIFPIFTMGATVCPSGVIETRE